MLLVMTFEFVISDVSVASNPSFSSWVANSLTYWSVSVRITTYCFLSSFLSLLILSNSFSLAYLWSLGSLKNEWSRFGYLSHILFTQPLVDLLILQVPFWHAPHSSLWCSFLMLLSLCPIPSQSYQKCVYSSRRKILLPIRDFRNPPQYCYIKSNYLSVRERKYSFKIAT